MKFIPILLALALPGDLASKHDDGDEAGSQIAVREISLDEALQLGLELTPQHKAERAERHRKFMEATGVVVKGWILPKMFGFLQQDLPKLDFPLPFLMKRAELPTREPRFETEAEELHSKPK